MLEVFDLKWIPILLGSDFKTNMGNLLTTDKLTVSGGKVTLSDTPKTGTLEVYVLKTDEVSFEQEIKVGAITNPNEYTITSRDISFNATSQPDGTRVICFYVPQTAVVGKSYKVLSTGNNANYEIYGVAQTKNANGDDELLKFYIPNGTPISEFTIALDVENIAKLSVQFEMLEGVFPDTKEKGLIDIIILE